jgi:glycosyltransferase involved in cell wall biosynthesis
LRLLLCCESYPPHRGGVQEVMRQLAERLAARGHDVTVATSRHRERTSSVVNGVKIRAFNAGGKMVYGLDGQVDDYREFVRTFEADAILIMAAQQWSFDALWPVLDDIKARKVFIPCGFSGLYEPDFADYFRELPTVLRKFDHLIFNAEKYRDIDFVRSIGLTNFTVLPNGISEGDFDREPDGQFRQKLGIPQEAFLFLTVGNPIEAKGHREVVDAFSRLDTGGRSAVLLSIAGWTASGATTMAHRLIEIVRLQGVRGLARLVRRRLARYRSVSAARPQTDVVPAAPPLETIESMAAKVSAQPLKSVILTDLERRDLIQAYLAADLFVFASRVEYSPLVLFEAAAAGTPFLTVPVGNAAEIVRWTGGGMICEATKDSRGYTRVDPGTLAREMARCMNDRDKLSRLGATARERWRNHFTWKVVTGYYEDILAGRIPNVQITEFKDSLPGEQPISSVA